jgi:hypothetical protein
MKAGAERNGAGEDLGSPDRAPASARVPLSGRQWRQIAGLTLGAIAIYATMRALPTGTNLHAVDFAAGKGALEMCDPANPQFVPVVAVRSPVTMTLSPSGAVQTGQKTQYLMTLGTSTGRPIGPADLLIAHTQKMHLLIADPTLTDYQHIHPEPGAKAGEWTFAFTPRRAGLYRVFADFTPAVTGRSLYASADVAVAAAVGAEQTGDRTVARDQEMKPDPILSARMKELKPDPFSSADPFSSEVDGVRFTLRAGQEPIRAGEPEDLSLAITRDDGKPVALEPVMGAYAHLVAFDNRRSGFAHLHPMQADPSIPPDPVKPVLPFKLKIPLPGRYVIWAQVKPGGHETFVPFWFDVVP